MVILVVVTAVASAGLDNVTTVLLIAPVTFLVCDRLGVPVAPFLIAEAMASNIGGTSTLVGDPPNIIIGSRGGLSYNDFLLHLAPIVVVLMVVFVLLCRVLFRKAFVYRPERAQLVMQLSERDAIRNPRLLALSGGVLVLVTVAFVLHTVLGLEPSVVAILGGLLLLALSRLDAGEVARDVEWPTLVLLRGPVRHGRGPGQHRGDRPDLPGGHRRGGRSAVAGEHDAAVGVGVPFRDVLWWSLALGADLGGNATAIGASANVVILGMAEREGRRISFWEFSKYGLIITAVTIILCVPYLWLRYFAFA